jgi:hypothetical protein
MAEYTVAIPGEYGLERVNLAIAGEEAGASEFRGARMGTVDGRLVNVAQFGALGPGTVPAPLKILPKDDPPPPGAKPVWSGTIAVDGRTIPVVAYRAVSTTR